MLKYYYRASAVLYALSWLVWATSKIGITSVSTPISWHGAWLFAGIIAAGMIFAWLARGEYEQSRKGEQP